MRVLFAVSEAAPIVKIGGLGDVGGSLPPALKKLGVDISVVIPFYDPVDREKYRPEKVAAFKTYFAGGEEPTAVYKTFLPQSDVPTYLIENEKYLSGGGKDAFTGLEDEIKRFSFFCKAIQQWLVLSDKAPRFDVVHCQDWHTGLLPHLLKDALGEERPATVLTIHNLGYQGVGRPEILDEIGLPASRSRLLQWDIKDGDVNFMMQGIVTADVINAVSPTYAREILTPEYGYGLEQVLKAREARLFGILNGIDDEKFDPGTDGGLVRNYQVKSQKSLRRQSYGASATKVKSMGIDGVVEAKRENKEFLQKKVGLVKDPEVPLLAFIGRLDSGQKGLDILEEVLEKLFCSCDPCGRLNLGRGQAPQLQFILLGTGDHVWEEKFKKLASKYPGRFAAMIRFDNELASQIYAGADMLVVPSRYEPCGLIQMIAMRYGTIPIVRRTGGLADSVEDGVTGFQFKKYSAEALFDAIERALGEYQNKSFWQRMIESAMRRDFTWDASAGEYVELYRKAMEFKNSLAMTKAFADRAPVREGAVGGRFRKDPLSDDWAVLAAKRAARPETVKKAAADKPVDPFAEGNEAMTPPEVFRIGKGKADGPGWEVRVIPNKFPITDYHEVIIHSPDSEKDLDSLPAGQTEKILRACKARYNFYKGQREDFYIHLFNNTGSDSGASLKHPHSQMVVFNRLPEMVLEEAARAREFYAKEKVCVYCDYVQKELTYQKRVVKKTKYFIVLAPFASAWPYQLLLIPLKHQLSFGGISPLGIKDLARLLKGITGALKKGFPEPSYNFWIHSIPSAGIWADLAEYYHWHLEFIPRLKKLGGVELGAGVMVDDKASPEDAAEFYRNPNPS